MKSKPFKGKMITMGLNLQLFTFKAIACYDLISFFVLNNVSESKKLYIIPVSYSSNASNFKFILNQSVLLKTM